MTKSSREIYNRPLFARRWRLDVGTSGCVAVGRWPLAVGRWPLAVGRWPSLKCQARNTTFLSDVRRFTFHVGSWMLHVERWLVVGRRWTL